MGKILVSKARPGLPWAARRAGDDYGARDEPDWREVNWQPHLHQIEIAGRSVNYADYGSADSGTAPVVFVHGLGGCWQNWLENVPRVAASGRRVLALDLPGFGYSEMPVDEISISGFGKLLNELCDRLDLGECILVGNSMGGFVSAEVAIQFPARVARLVLVSAAGLTTTDVSRGPITAGFRLAAAIGARTAAMSEKVVVRPRLRAPLYSSFIRYPARIPTDLLYEITRGSGRPGFMPALRAILEYDFRDRLSEIRCPTLIIWGSEDLLVPREDADEFENVIPNSRKIIFEDTGHTAMLERPPTFNDRLLEFLDEDHTPARPEAEVEAASAS